MLLYIDQVPWVVAVLGAQLGVERPRLCRVSTGAVPGQYQDSTRAVLGQYWVSTGAVLGLLGPATGGSLRCK